MIVDCVIGKKVRRTHPGGSNGRDGSWMRNATTIIKVEDGLIYHSPELSDGSVYTLPYRDWCCDWEEVVESDVGIKRVSLSTGSVQLVVDKANVAKAVDEIQNLGLGFEIISAENGRVLADKFFGDSNKSVRIIKDLVKRGWTWE